MIDNYITSIIILRVTYPDTICNVYINSPLTIWNVNKYSLFMIGMCIDCHV